MAWELRVPPQSFGKSLFEVSGLEFLGCSAFFGALGVGISGSP